MRIGLYPGTFDPITLGHVDIIRRACGLVDRLVIGIADQSRQGSVLHPRGACGDGRGRVRADRAAAGVEIVAHPFENLLIHCAADVDASVIIRGLRAVSDFEYEFQMVGMNRAMNDDIETVFLMADAHYQAIASRLVKEIARLGGDVRGFVPPRVAEALADRIAPAPAQGVDA